MTRKPRTHSKVVSFDNRQREAMEIVRKVVSTDTSKIKLSRHAMERMERRNITSRDIYRALQHGDPIGVAEQGKEPDETKIVVTFKPRGAREIAVVTLVVTGKEMVFVKTVMWRDEQ